MVNESDQISRADYIPYTQSAARDTAVPRFGRPQDVKGGVTRPVRSIAWSCDGKKIATGTEVKGLRVWDVRDKVESSTSFPLPSEGDKATPHNGHVAALAFSPVEPNILVSGCKSSFGGACVAVWDIDSRKAPLATFKISGDVLHIAFHPSGKQFAVVCPKSRDEVFFFWRIPRDGAEVWEKREDVSLGGVHVDNGSEEINSLRFSNSGKLVCAVSNDGSLNAWIFSEAPRASVPNREITETEASDASGLSSPQEAEEEPDRLKSRAPSRDATPEAEEKGEDQEGEARGAEDGGQSAEGGEAAEGKSQEDADMGYGAAASATEDVAAAANGEMSASGADIGAASEDVVMTDPANPVAANGSAAPSRQPTPPAPVIPAPQESKIDAAAEARRTQLKRFRHMICAAASLLSLSLDPTGRFLAIGGQDALLSLFDSTDWICVRTFDVCMAAIRHTAFSPDGELIAMGGDDPFIAIVSVFSGQTIAKIPIQGLLQTLSWHPGLNWLAYSTNLKTAVVWYIVHQE